MKDTLLTDKVRQLRKNGFSIREIARELDVSKYTVEKAVKELMSDSPQTVSQTNIPENQTLGRTAFQTNQAAAQTGQDSHQTLFQTPETPLETVPQTATGVDLFKEDVPEIAEKPAEPQFQGYFLGVYGFMLPYRLFLRDLRVYSQRQREMWDYELQYLFLDRLEELQARAQYHCHEHGVAYECLFVSEALGACEDYLYNNVMASPVYIGSFGWRKYRFALDSVVSELCKVINPDNFFYMKPD